MTLTLIVLLCILIGCIVGYCWYYFNPEMYSLGPTEDFRFDIGPPERIGDEARISILHKFEVDKAAFVEHVHVIYLEDEAGGFLRERVIGKEPRIWRWSLSE